MTACHLNGSRGIQCCKMPLTLPSKQWSAESLEAAMKFQPVKSEDESDDEAMTAELNRLKATVFFSFNHYL